MTHIQDALDAIRKEMPGLADGQAELYAVLLLTRGTDATEQDVHTVWCVWATSIGRPGDPAVVPWEDLPAMERKKDEFYLNGVHRATRRYHRVQQRRAHGRWAPR